MADDTDPTVVRDAMLTRMAMATPGGPTFPLRIMPPVGLPRMFEDVKPVPVVGQLDGNKFDEAQAYATSRKGLIMHSQLMRLLAEAAVAIREQLAAGEPVIIVSGGRELMRLEP